METRHFAIKGAFARQKGIPASFVAVKILETAKALYVYGHGAIDPSGYCMRCGRELTHPGSILLGIGPECLGSWGMRDIRMNNVTEADKEYLKSLAREQKVDTWLPKSMIEEESETAEIINPPTDHPMFPKKKNGAGAKKEAVQVKYQNTGKPAIKITFPFNPETLALVKTLPGRSFHGDENPKYWTCPLSIEAVEKLTEWKFEMDSRLSEFVAKSKVAIEDMEEVVVPGLKKELFPFQKKGVAFIEAKGGRALIADSMGLGKTAQALSWLQLHPEKRPVIIVVPASLKLNWAKECQMWMGKPNVQILSGKHVAQPIIGDIIIINYDILPSWYGKLQEIKAQVMIIDEVHLIKSNQAKRTKTVKALGKGIPHIIALSGTPIVNRPIEAFNALKLIDDTVVPDFWKYAQRYCGARHNGFGWDYSGATHTDELHEKLTSTIMLRRLKKDVLQDLPDKTRAFLPIELNNRKEYTFAERDFVEWVRAKKGDAAAEKVSNAEALVQIETLKQLAVKGKLKTAIDWIRDFVEIDGKLIIFAVHKFVIDELMKAFGDIAVKVDGSVTGPNRDKAVEVFQNDDKIRLFIGNIKAAGVGLTLTAASNVVFLELPWSPGDVTQAEDRAHRIGQKNAVVVHYLLAQDTIEEKIAKMLDRKRKVLDAVLDGKETEQESLLTELIREYQ